jgi:hypothetical protein
MAAVQRYSLTPLTSSSAVVIGCCNRQENFLFLHSLMCVLVITKNSVANRIQTVFNAISHKAVVFILFALFCYTKYIVHSCVGLLLPHHRNLFFGEETGERIR